MTEAKNETAAPEVPKAPKDEKNGITRPEKGTKTGRVWEIADSLTASLGHTASRKEVVEAGRKESINDATIATQYGRWRKYHGITGTVSAPKPAAAEGAPAAEKKPRGKGKKGAEAAAPEVPAAPAAPTAPVDVAPTAPVAPVAPAAPVAEEEEQYQ